jgi:ribonuclease HI
MFDYGFDYGIYTDASCLPFKQYACGFGVVTINNGVITEESGGIDGCYNNHRAEVLAVMAGLKPLPEKAKVIIFVDCSYAVNMLNDAIKNKDGFVYKKNFDVFTWLQRHIENLHLDLCVKQVKGHGPKAPEHTKLAGKLAKEAAEKFAATKLEQWLDGKPQE